MMKCLRLKTILLGYLTSFTLIASIVGAYAWFQSEIVINNISGTGSSEGAYFAYGNGTSEHPFGINEPRHLYNLAWLQYNGMFNKDEKNNGSGASGSDGAIDKQYHFEIDPSLSSPLDMSGWTLPPIGTERHPFLGSFNGNNKTITGLTTSNQAAFAQKPTSINYDVQPEIVGFFGVVGSPTSLSYTYDSSIVSLSNVTLDTITVESKTSQTLIGLAAGYVDGHMSGVKVGESSISVTGCKPITSITDNLSDYSLVGYAEATSTVSDFTKSVSEELSKRVSGGNVGGFGASVNFKDYTNWFWDLHMNKGYDAGSGSRDIGFLTGGDMPTSFSQQYSDLAEEDFLLRLWSVNRPANPNYEVTFGFIKGELQYNPWGANFYSASFGLNYTGTNTFEGKFYETNRGKTAVDSYAFTGSVSGSNSNPWKNVYTINFTSTYPSWAEGTVYLYGTAQSGVKVYTDASHSSEVKMYSGKSGSFFYRDNMVYNLENENYIPLTFSDDTKTSAASDNTGYITGVNLANDTKNNSVGSPRLASYSTSKYLNNSLDDNGSISAIKTYYNGNWTTISDTKDAEGIVTSCDKNYERYVSSRNALANIVEGQSTVHGIHFDVSTINNYATATDKKRGSIDERESVTINARLKSYGGAVQATKVPKGCIDFELENEGFINFFAGLYNSGDIVTKLNFFALHHVLRTSPTAFTLKEIEAIYKSTNWTSSEPDYVYKYADGTYSSGTISGEALFDLKTALWSGRAKDNSIYYFEIPVNEGEYVMGGVDNDSAHVGKSAPDSGAYMMYLDIGSNGRSAGNTTMDAHFVKTTSGSDKCPNGVDFNITSLSAVGGNTICIRLTYSDLENMAVPITGSIAFTPASRVTVDSNIAGAGCSYDAGGKLDTTGSHQSISDFTGAGGGGNRILYASINTSSGDSWELEYQEILNGSGNVTSSNYLIAIKNGIDVTSAVNSSSETVPEVFTSSVSEIEDTQIAVTLVYRGNDFHVRGVSYDGTTIDLTIPADELGATSLTRTFPTGSSYSTLKVNGSIYPSS